VTAAETAAVLLVHQGPYFNGVESRCSCGQLVLNGHRWAEHVTQQLQSAENTK